MTKMSFPQAAPRLFLLPNRSHKGLATPELGQLTRSDLVASFLENTFDPAESGVPVSQMFASRGEVGPLV